MITTPLWWSFLIISPVVYWLLPVTVRAAALALMSFGLLMYYAPLDIASLAVLATIIFAAHKIPKDSGPLASAVARIGQSHWPMIVILAYFFWTKYLPSIMMALSHQASFLDLVIPLGISYFTFKLLHYSIERKRGTLPEHSYADFAAFMFLAPIFTAGPIERFDHFLQNRATRFEWDFIFEGLTGIAQGLVKKFVFGLVAFELLERYSGGDFGTLAANLETVPTAQIWACLFLALAYSYFDFSAYSDIAIGSSRLFGLRIMENFNMPFLARSLRDFWQRWHMTLASWVLTYVYMPLVGHTRNPFVSIVVTFAVVGVWHAAWPLHWLFWGLWHGIGLAILIWWTRLFQKRRSKFLQRKPVRLAGWAITMIYVAMSEAFPSLYGLAPLSDAFRILFAAFGLI